jgi:integrase
MLIGELITKFLDWNVRHRAPATFAFYHARLKRFYWAFYARDFSSLTPREIDEHLATAGTGMSDSTRHHDVVALERLQKFALAHKLLASPIFGNLEKPRVGRRDRVPTATETAAILAQASLKFTLIYSALRQCGARPGELCRATIADVDRANCVITLKEHKTARKTGQARRIPIGTKLRALLDQAIGQRPSRRAVGNSARRRRHSTDARHRPDPGQTRWYGCEPLFLGLQGPRELVRNQALRRSP